MSQPQLNPTHLQNRLSKWIGYGDLASCFWFLGMEEGGKASFPEQQLRISLAPVSPLSVFIHQLNLISGINAPWKAQNIAHVKLQKTYVGLIKVFLCAVNRCGYSQSGHPYNPQVLKLFQRDELGEPGYNNLLAELMPLSRHNRGVWPYAQWTNRPDLQTSSIYHNTWLAKRITMYQTLISIYKPSAILAYGKEFWKYYKQLLPNTSFTPILGGTAETGGPIVLIKHTSATPTNKYLSEVGHWIRTNLKPCK